MELMKFSNSNPIRWIKNVHIINKIPFFDSFRRKEGIKFIHNILSLTGDISACDELQNRFTWYQTCQFDISLNWMNVERCLPLIYVLNKLFGIKIKKTNCLYFRPCLKHLIKIGEMKNNGTFTCTIIIMKTSASCNQRFGEQC